MEEQDEFAGVESVEVKAKEESSGGFIPFLSLKENEEALIRFLHREPLVLYQHREMDPFKNENQGGWAMLTCTKPSGKCILCDIGSKRSYRGAYLVVHIDAVVEGVKVPTVKILSRGINDLRTLDAKDKKFGITTQNLEMTRIGKGTATRYMFDKTSDEARVEFDSSPIGGANTEEQCLAFLKTKFKAKRERMKQIAEYRKGGGAAAPPVADPPVGNAKVKLEDIDEDDFPF